MIPANQLRIMGRPISTPDVIEAFARVAMLHSPTNQLDTVAIPARMRTVCAECELVRGVNRDWPCTTAEALWGESVKGEGS